MLVFNYNGINYIPKYRRSTHGDDGEYKESLFKIRMTPYISEKFNERMPEYPSVHSLKPNEWMTVEEIWDEENQYFHIYTKNEQDHLSEEEKGNLKFKISLSELKENLDELVLLGIVEANYEKINDEELEEKINTEFAYRRN